MCVLKGYELGLMKRYDVLWKKMAEHEEGVLMVKILQQSLFLIYENSSEKCINCIKGECGLIFYLSADALLHMQMEIRTGQQ